MVEHQKPACVALGSSRLLLSPIVCTKEPTSQQILADYSPTLTSATQIGCHSPFSSFTTTQKINGECLQTSLCFPCRHRLCVSSCNALSECDAWMNPRKNSCSTAVANGDHNKLTKPCQPASKQSNNKEVFGATPSLQLSSPSSSQQQSLTDQGTHVFSS